MSHKTNATEFPSSPQLLIEDVLGVLSPARDAVGVVAHRDLFFVDLIGNTICADLLDYVMRDASNSGLRVQFDDRVIRYLCLVSVKDGLSPTRRPCIRVAVQFFTNKMRHDVLSELSGILKARYLIHERIINHPTKSAAGAMLGSAVLLLGIDQMPPWIQTMGDHEFITMLYKTGGDILVLAERIDTAGVSIEDAIAELWPADSLQRALVSQCVGRMVPEDCDQERCMEAISERAQAAKVVLWKLGSRRFPKLVFRLRRKDVSDQRYPEFAQAYSSPDARYELEREVERVCSLPIGSVFIHCPRALPGLKPANVLMVGSDLSKVHRLRDVVKFGEELEPYELEIQAVEKMYDSVWSMHCFLDVAFYGERELVVHYLEHKLRVQNDRLLGEELALEEGPEEWRLLCGKHADLVGYAQWPEVVEGVRQRMRHGALDPEERLLDVIREVMGAGPEQLELEVV